MSEKKYQPLAVREQRWITQLKVFTTASPEGIKDVTAEANAFMKSDSCTSASPEGIKDVTAEANAFMKSDSCTSPEVHINMAGASNGFTYSITISHRTMESE